MAEKIEKYKYYYRPEYNSGNFLIEFFNGTENESFIQDFLSALSTISPKINDVNDLWMNDEILLRFESDLGQFNVSKDNWGFVFVMASENQNCIQKINSILLSDSKFKNVIVDNEKYKL